MFDREQYLESNLRCVQWRDQRFDHLTVSVVDDTAVLWCLVTDEVDGEGRSSFRMPMTQTWVRGSGQWQQLAGHAGPLLVD